MTEGQPPRHDPPPQSPQSPQSPQYGPPAGAGPHHPGPAQYGPPPGQQPGNGMAVAALVLGIVGAVFVIIFFPLALVLGILAIIFGFIGRNRYNRNPAVGRKGMAIAGLILGIIATVLSIALFILVGVAIDEGIDQLNSDEFQEQLEELETQ